MVGLHNLVATSVLESDMDLRTDLLSNVIMAGANTMFPNLAERLQRELETMTYVETPYPCDKLARYAARMFSTRQLTCHCIFIWCS